jgi:glycosyltransferase involved in cell wall biosynthesis
MSDNVVAMAGGVDVALFARARRAPQPVPERPLCAYFGAISAANHLDLLRDVSHRYRLRLIGPVRSDLSGFAPETEIVGAVPQERLPELLYDADVLLLPYARSSHNQSVIPAKLFECLATGKPTVVFGLDALSDYTDVFYVCETEEAFLAAIDAAVHEPAARRAARIACAEENSYDQLVTMIEGYFQDVLAEKGQPELALARS